MAGRKKLSPKQKGFAEDYVETRNATEAAMQNYNVKNRRSAALVGCTNLQKPEVVSEIERIMEEKDMTDDFLMQRLKEGLDANIVTDYKGEITESQVPDMKIRHKYFESAAKIKGLLKEVTENRNLNIDAELEKMSPEQIQALIKGLSEHYSNQAKENEHIKTAEEGDFREDGTGDNGEHFELGDERKAYSSSKVKGEGG